jgi:hypothetical protein
MTGETLERISALDAPPLYQCTECGGVSKTRLPNHKPDCRVIA